MRPWPPAGLASFFGCSDAYHLVFDTLTRYYWPEAFQEASNAGLATFSQHQNTQLPFTAQP
jgi:hypothetical protein